MTRLATRTGLQLRSLITGDGALQVSLLTETIPLPAPDEVVVRIEATPLNSSDIGPLLGAADLRTARVTGHGAGTVLTATVPQDKMAGMAARIGVSMPIGNEGAGIVVDAGASPRAQALLGRVVAMRAGSMYSQFRCVKVEECLVLPEGTKPAEAASCFVNPLTALGLVETMRREGHSALVNTAAASNLGQMLNRICVQDGIGLVNIVRRPEQVHLLRSMGAAHVCDASAPGFMADLTDALVATGATIAFDPTGGGRLVSQILHCMEAALTRTASTFSRYGSTTHKQVYIYGNLDGSPTVIDRSFGLAWGMGGWLVTPFLQKIGPEAAGLLKARAARELRTTFASRYAGSFSFVGALQPGAIERYAPLATGTKYIINPALGPEEPSA